MAVNQKKLVLKEHFGKLSKVARKSANAIKPIVRAKYRKITDNFSKQTGKVRP